MSDPDTGRGIPEQEQFSTSAERHEFSRAVNFDPHVTNAVEIMNTPEPSGVMDRLLDELSAEQKKESPDQSVIEKIQSQLAIERELLSVQTVTATDAERLQSDQMETRELNDREMVMQNIQVTAKRIAGLEVDIPEMADNAIANMAEEYSPAMKNVLEEVEAEVEATYEDVAKIFSDIQPNEVVARLQDSIQMQRFSFTILTKVYGLLTHTEHLLIDLHTSMLRAVDAWRQEHQPKS